MFDVLFLRVVIDQNVVQISGVEYVQVFAKDIIDESLKGTWRIAESEGHHDVFKKAVSCQKRRLFLMPLLNPNFVESGNYVEFGVSFGHAELR